MFLELFIASSLPVVKVVLLCGIGALCARKGLLTYEGRKMLSGVAYMVFIPALNFTSLASSITPGRLVRWWPLVLNVGLSTLIGAGLGFLNVLLVRPERWFRRHLVASVMFGNVGNLPLVIVATLAKSSSEVLGGVPAQQANDLAVSYVVLGLIIACILQPTLGFAMLKKNPKYEPSEGSSSPSPANSSSASDGLPNDARAQPPCELASIGDHAHAVIHINDNAPHQQGQHAVAIDGSTNHVLYQQGQHVSPLHMNNNTLAASPGQQLQPAGRVAAVEDASYFGAEQAEVPLLQPIRPQSVQFSETDVILGEGSAAVSSSEANIDGQMGMRNGMVMSMADSHNNSDHLLSSLSEQVTIPLNLASGAQLVVHENLNAPVTAVSSSVGSTAGPATSTTGPFDKEYSNPEHVTGTSAEDVERAVQATAGSIIHALALDPALAAPKPAAAGPSLPSQTSLAPYPSNYDGVSNDQHGAALSNGVSFTEQTRLLNGNGSHSFSDSPRLPEAHGMLGGSSKRPNLMLSRWTLEFLSKQYWSLHQHDKHMNGREHYSDSRAVAATASASSADLQECSAPRGTMHAMDGVVQTPRMPFGQSATHILLRNVSASSRGIAKIMIRDVFSPPVIAIVLAMLVGCIRPIQELLYRPEAPLGLLADSIQMLADCAIPSILLSLGATLAKGPGVAKVPLRLIISTAVCRLLILPLVGIGIVIGAYKAHLYHAPDPIFLLVLLIQNTAPTAILVHTMSSVHQNGEQEVSALLFWQYLASIVTIPPYLALFLYTVQRVYQP